jgi:hypothetical protein
MNSVEKFFNVLGAIVVVAGVTTVVARGDKAAKVIGAFGDLFSNGISAALGKGINFN